MNLPRCEATDLPRLLCACPVHANWAFDEDDLEPAELDYLTGKVIIPAEPQYRDYHLLRVDYQSHQWRYLGQKHVPDLIVCDHNPDTTHLCFPCAVQFRHLLADIPGLVSDLLVAFAKETAFAERGVLDTPYPEAEDSPNFVGPYTEEAGLHWNPTASNALRRLQKALGGPPVPTATRLLTDWRTTLQRPDLAFLAASVSGAARQAVSVVNAPPVWQFYGQCPECGKGIRQERVDPHDPDGKVDCPDCDYTAPLKDHLHLQLDVGADTWYTERELLDVLKQAGEELSRSEFVNIKYREGLVRETGMRRRWRGGRPEDYTVEVFRLGDVRDIVARRQNVRETAS